MGNSTFWAGNQQYLDNPLTPGNIGTFEVKNNNSGRFGISEYTLIKF